MATSRAWRYALSSATGASGCLSTKSCFRVTMWLMGKMPVAL